eukprot:8610424-Pyramimonas_sp.AAC.1
MAPLSTGFSATSNRALWAAASAATFSRTALRTPVTIPSGITALGVTGASGPDSCDESLESQA